MFNECLILDRHVAMGFVAFFNTHRKVDPSAVRTHKLQLLGVRIDVVQSSGGQLQVLY